MKLPVNPFRPSGAGAPFDPGPGVCGRPGDPERRMVRSLVRFLGLAAAAGALLTVSPARAEYRLLQAFPYLTFTFATDIQPANDGTDRLFVVEKRGVIWVFTGRDAVHGEDRVSQHLDQGAHERRSRPARARVPPELQIERTVFCVLRVAVPVSIHHRPLHGERESQRRQFDERGDLDRQRAADRVPQRRPTRVRSRRVPLHRDGRQFTWPRPRRTSPTFPGRSCASTWT